MNKKIVELELELHEMIINFATNPPDTCAKMNRDEMRIKNQWTPLIKEIEKYCELRKKHLPSGYY